MKRKILAGTTSRKERIAINDFYAITPSTIGLSGVLFNSPGMSGYYIRDGDSSPTQITLATATVGSYTSGGFKEINPITLRGVYEVGIPDAALAVGSNCVDITYYGAANMVPVKLEIELDKWDYQNTIENLIWDAAMSGHNINGSFGSGNQPVYYADTKFINDSATPDNEFTAIWYKNGSIVPSSQLTNPAISVHRTTDGSSIIANKSMFYVTSSFGIVRWNESPSVIASGEPYYISVSGSIDGAVRTWRTLFGLDLL